MKELKREFLQLSHIYNPARHSINGWYMSEKLDGMRCFWDGGVSRNLPANEVPWANTAKDARYRNQQYATGLWTRYGNVIHAPDWWLDQLPPILLDGELWIGRKQFQQIVSIVKDLIPGPGWEHIKYAILDSPPMNAIFADSEINVPNYRKTFDGCIEWVERKSIVQSPPLFSFEETYNYLRKNIDSPNCFVHEQEQLPFNTKLTNNVIETKLEQVIEQGGEGLIFRRPVSTWEPNRSHNCLKFKPYNDDEGIVTGYIWGKETDKGSKLLGLMGALIINFNGKRLELSGFTDLERGMITTNQLQLSEPILHSGEEVSSDWYNPTFPIGSKITFRYRELSNDGVPKEARYWRKSNQ